MAITVLVGEKVVGSVDGNVVVNGNTVTGSGVLDSWIKQANETNQPLALAKGPGGFSITVYEGGAKGGVTTTLKDFQSV